MAKRTVAYLQEIHREWKRKREREHMKKKRETGTCKLCGKEALVKNYIGYQVCATCETVLRSAKLRPELTVQMIREFHDDKFFPAMSDDDTIAGVRAALKVGDQVASSEIPGLVTDLMEERKAYAVELDNIRKALGAGGDDDLCEVAKARMAAISMLNEDLEELQGKAGEQFEAVLEEREGPADMVCISRILTDSDLLDAVNELARRLRPAVFTGGM